MELRGAQRGYLDSGQGRHIVGFDRGNLLCTQRVETACVECGDLVR